MGKKLTTILILSVLVGAVVAFAWGLWVFISPQLWLLRSCHQWAGDWGRGILLATALNHVAFSVLLYAMQPAGRLKAIRPEIDAVELRYANDSVRKNAEIMQLYRREGITGWTVGAPMLLFPVLMWLIVSFFVALWRMPELHGAAFLWIPDLSAPDPLYRLPLIQLAISILRSLISRKKRSFAERIVLLVFTILLSASMGWLLPASFILSMCLTQLLTFVHECVRRLFFALFRRGTA